MEVSGFSALSLFQNERTLSARNSSDQNFLNNLLEVAQGASKIDVPKVFAGVGKELDFWSKEEKVFSKPEKLRTVDDSLFEIEEILRQLKQNK